MSEKVVYKKIAAVMAEMAKEGIGKDRSNQAQGYKFRGIDDVYNALAGPMSRNGLVVLPRITEREVIEKLNAKGTALFYVTVKAEFDFVAAEDGSFHTVATYGEAMDSGDKATNKAMSAAFKYACMQAFCIPTEGDNDADAQTHEVQPQRHGIGKLDRQNMSAPDADEPIRPDFGDKVDAILKGLAAEDDFRVYENAVSLNNAEKLKARNDGLLSFKDFDKIRTIIASVKAEDKKTT